MADTANVRIVVLWCHELRIAARALAHARKLMHDEGAPHKERTDALLDALNAAGAALNSPELLGDGPIVTAEAPMWVKEEASRG